MKNIHVIPTDKPSRLSKHIYFSGLVLTEDFFEGSIGGNIAQHIYITSDEEIKEGDIVKIPCGIGKVKELHWKYGNDVPSYIVEDLFVHKLRYGQKEGELETNSFRYEDVKKIILTTDQDLIKDGIQAIDDKFLEWFVAHPSCEEVKIQLEVGSLRWSDSKNTYKIIIPKEEPKQDCKHDIVTKYGVAECQNCGMEENEIVREKPKQQSFTKPDTIDGEWLSPIATERAWQEEQLVNIFEHYPNASPKWQYMNGLIQNSLDAKEMYSEEDMKKAFEAGKKGYMRGSYLTQEYYFTWNNFKSWFEQFKKK